MKRFAKLAVFGLPLLVAAGVSCPSGRAQAAAAAPIIVDTAVPIIVNAVKPKPKPNGLAKFEGFVMHANIAQITARAKGNDMSIQTFSLSQEASVRMQQIVDKGGYQWGDKITIYFDPATMKAFRFKGKPSKPL
ncbi:MAG TPA: hypothetical protein VE263_15255 [Candidatus Angelobacter sp.]|nr:hypothetical protein [Candidatus Angelobacter sp.]